jgi:hypothetical protein
MEYIRLMTNLSEHPKWLDTSHAGRSVLIGIWLYCGRNETGGQIPDAAARREGLTGKLASRLEELGWIHRNGSGWHVHDWDEHQVSVEGMAAAKERQRAYDAQRKARQRARRTKGTA